MNDAQLPLAAAYALTAPLGKVLAESEQWSRDPLRAEAVRWALTSPPAATPGSYAYSNVVYMIAGAIVLDHHKSTKHIVLEFGENGVYADEKTEPGVSGAVLAFREVWKPIEAEAAKDTDVVSVTHEYIRNFARLAGIRWAVPRSRSVRHRDWCISWPAPDANVSASRVKLHLLLEQLEAGVGQPRTPAFGSRKLLLEFLQRVG